ncbi:MAG: hypothetical protein JST80_02800 [Bdellovibrionales bacterium]|nr:hypothetical protein [Bdellovibrionales bacterium]
MDKPWKVIETRSAAKELLRLPIRIQRMYRQLIEDLENEGPRPYGWDSAALQGMDGIRVRLNREYRVIIEVMRPNIIVVKIAHRKEAYE